MSWLVFAGCVLTAASPLVAFFIFQVSKDSFSSIIVLIAGFFWLLAFMGVSVVWSILIPLREYFSIYCIIGVVFQEIARFGLYSVVAVFDKKIHAMERPTHSLPVRFFRFSLGAGLGYSFTEFLVTYATPLLPLSIGPAALYRDSCPGLPFLYYGALSSMLGSLANINLMIIAFVSFRERNWIGLFIVYVAHLGLSLLTLLGEVKYGCYGVLALYLPAIISLFGVSHILVRKSIGKEGNPID